MKRLFLSGLAVNVLVMGIGFITGILSARYLGPEGRGVLAVATRWSGLFVMLFSVGLPGAFIYLGKQFPEKQRELFGSYLLMGLTAGMLGLFIGLALLPFLLANQPAEVILLAQVAMMAVPCGVMADGLLGSLQTLNSFGKVMALRILNPLLTLLIILGLLAFDRYSVGTFVAASVIGSVFLFFIPLLWVYRVIRPRFVQIKANSQSLFSMGVQLYAGGLAASFGVNLDQLIMSLFLSTYSLGLYAVAASIGTMLASVVIGSIGIYLFPKLMDMEIGYRRKRAGEIHAALFYGTFLFSIAGIALLPFFLPLLYGSEYALAVGMGQILLVTAPIQVAYTVLINYLSTEGKFHSITLSEITGLAAGLLVMLMLLRALDGVGAAIGVTAAAYVKWAVALYPCLRSGIAARDLFRLSPVHAANLLRGLQRKRKTQTANR